MTHYVKMIEIFTIWIKFQVEIYLSDELFYLYSIEQQHHNFRSVHSSNAPIHSD